MAMGSETTSAAIRPGAASIDELLARQPQGTALLQEFYTDPAIYQRDLERIHLRHWLCVGHGSRISKPGDYFVYDVAGESIIVVRGRDGVIRALINVCRHRGSQVCYEKQGNARVLVCPYHAWAYELDGSLRSARHTEKDFDRSRYGLKRIHARVAEGLIFVCFAENPLGFESVEQSLKTSLRRHGWADAKVAHRAVYSVDANWKLATENYFECYHCGPAHPEFSWYHATEKPDAQVEELREETNRRARKMGVEIPWVNQWPENSDPTQEAVDCWHDATYSGSVTGSEDGQPVAPLMGDFTEYHGGFTYVDVGPASFFLAYSDYGVMYLFIPRDVQKTDMEVVWLVKGDAQEGEDFQLDRVTWMWNVTSVADKRIIDHNQQGVNSRYYEPGPYVAMERTARKLSEWYLRQIAG